MMLTGRLIIRTYVGRGAMLWLLTRALISAVIVAANGNPLALSPRSVAIVILVSTVSGLAQSARLREWALLANLGVSRTEAAVYLALPALVAELCVAVANASLA